MSKKSEKRSKDRGIKVISQPMNFQHRFHVGIDSVNLEELQALFESASQPGNPPSPVTGDRCAEKEASTEDESRGNTMRNVTPPPPCQSRDISGEGGYQTEGLVELLKQELIPALRFEIDQLLDQKFSKWFGHVTDKEAEVSHVPIAHCKTHCKCRTLHLGSNTLVSFNALESGETTPDDEPFPVYMNDVAHPELPQPPRNLNQRYDPLANGDVHPARKSHSNSPRLGASGNSSHSNSPRLEDKRKRIVHNPVYPVEVERHVISNTPPQNRKQKTGSSNASSPRQSTRETSSDRDNSVTSSGHVVTDKGHQDFDERECLSKAVELHRDAIAEWLVQKHGELQDKLIEKGVITPSERTGILKNTDIKEQRRETIELIMGKNLPILRTFLKLLKSRNATVYQNVVRTFERYKRGDAYSSTQCVVCGLMAQVDVKSIIDSLWSAGIVNTELLSLVRASELPTGDQDVLWQHVLYAINNFLQTDRRTGISVLSTCLKRSQHDADLAQPLKANLIEGDFLHCTCKSRDQMSKLDMTQQHILVTSHTKPSPHGQNISRDQGQSRGRKQTRSTSKCRAYSEERAKLNTGEEKFFEKPISKSGLSASCSALDLDDLELAGGSETQATEETYSGEYVGLQTRKHMAETTVETTGARTDVAIETRDPDPSKQNLAEVSDDKDVRQTTASDKRKSEQQVEKTLEPRSEQLPGEKLEQRARKPVPIKRLSKLPSTDLQPSYV